MAKRMLIDAAHPEETRVVVLSGNRLEEFDFESSTKKQVKGNIYLAKVTRVEPSLQAAFVDYGGNRHGFLAFSEIHPGLLPHPGQRPVGSRRRAGTSRPAAARRMAATMPACRSPRHCPNRCRCRKLPRGTTTPPPRKSEPPRAPGRQRARGAPLRRTCRAPRGRSRADMPNRRQDFQRRRSTRRRPPTGARRSAGRARRQHSAGSEPARSSNRRSPPGRKTGSRSARGRPMHEAARIAATSQARGMTRTPMASAAEFGTGVDCVARRRRIVVVEPRSPTRR